MNQKSFFAVSPITSFPGDTQVVKNLDDLCASTGYVIVDITQEPLVKPLPGKGNAHNKQLKYVGKPLQETLEKTLQTPTCCHVHWQRSYKKIMVGYLLGESAEALRILAYLHTRRKINQKHSSGQEPLSYSLYEDTRYAKEFGFSLDLQVPSRTKKKPRHLIKLTHIPMKDDHDGKNVFPLSDPVRFYSYMNMRFFSNAITPREITFFSPHAMAGYHYVAMQKYPENTHMWHRNPFPIWNTQVMQFYRHLLHYVGIKNNKNGEISTQHPSVAERSVLFHAYLKRKIENNEPILYNKKNDGPLMPMLEDIFMS
ncbi:MAG: hypothetical protein ACMXYC_02450 [Candidatus Woesearchaeota archaeon]